MCQLRAKLALTWVTFDPRMANLSDFDGFLHDFGVSVAYGLDSKNHGKTDGFYRFSALFGCLGEPGREGTLRDGRLRGSGKGAGSRAGIYKDSFLRISG